MNRLARMLRAAALATCLITGTVKLADQTASAQSAPGLYVSVSGNDRQDGTSPAKALRTISAALSRARPGDTVYVGPGTYREQVVTQRAGAPGAEITIRGVGGKAVIDGSTLNWEAGKSQNQALVELRHPFVRVVNLTVQNSKNTGILLAADDLTVEDSKVLETQLHAISTDTSRQTNYHDTDESMIRRIVLKNNVIERASLDGNSQALSLIADGFLVTGNTVHSSMREGIDIWLGSRRGEVVGNTVYGNRATGIYVDGAAYVKIHRNVVFGNGSGIGVSSEDKDYTTHHIWVYNNIAYDNTNAGCFLWDDKWRPGYKGVQSVLIAYNTIARNKFAISVAGENNSARIYNNLGFSKESNVDDEGVNSSVSFRGNVWLTAASGFVAADRHDFRLTKQSSAIDKGIALSSVSDGAGGTFLIDSDFEGLGRIDGRNPDAGAFEYHRDAR